LATLRHESGKHGEEDVKHEQAAGPVVVQLAGGSKHVYALLAGGAGPHFRPQKARRRDRRQDGQ
jgi:hypothetical protein